MPEGASLEERVRLLVAAYTFLEPEIVELASRLREDLHINGDDAEELMVVFSATLGVDLADFDLSRHFDPEPYWCPLRWLIGPRPRPRSMPHIPLTVGELVKAARVGRWT